MFSSSEMLGSAIGMNIRSPSFSGGMNSLPMPRASDQRAGEQQRGRSTTVTTRCASAASSAGSIQPAQHRASRDWRPPRGTSRRAASVQSTGTSVTAMTVAASTANVFVNASGWNSLPSWPVSAKTGMNASRMIAIEKNTGRPTSRVDSRTVCHTTAAIAGIDAALLHEPERVLGDDDAGVDEHADGDGDAGEAHDVRRDAGVVHPEERHQHGQRQRHRHDQDRAEVHQEDDVRERDERDLFEQRVAQRVDGLLDRASSGRRRARS